MDTITHALFGLTTYAAVDKQHMPKPMKYALFVTALAGSEIPDIDVVSQLWDKHGQYQMWHRGLTHSVFLVPLWAALIAALGYLLFRVRSWKLYWIGLLSVFIHVTSDLFNAWGTGYLEPFSRVRISFGTVPIVDLTVWGIILSGFIASFMRKWAAHKVFKMTGLLVALHFLIQTVQGYTIYDSVKDRYDQTALAASFVPWHYQIIGKKGSQVEISEATVWSGTKPVQQLTSQENAKLDELFAQNPKAKTLKEWSPFVVIVENDKEIGIYDPRFYRNGQSFLFESIKKAR